MEFTEEQLERYSRHILLQDVGVEGQEKILKSRVLVIGAGGLGSPIALYLAAAGVGTIGIADFDKVDLSNLQRQIIHFTTDVGKFKAESAREKMLALNPDIKVNAIIEYLNCGNISSIIRDYDFVIDGTDNFASKFLINDACIFENKTFSHGGILRFDGQTITIKPGENSMLQMYIYCASARRFCSDLFTGRSIGSDSRDTRHDPSGRSIEIHNRNRRPSL